MSATDMTAALAAIDEFRIRLQFVADGDDGWAPGALTHLDSFAKLIPSLKAELRERYRSYLTGQIEQAAGAATTHDWRLDDSDLIVCAACKIHGPANDRLALGQVPPCVPNPACEHSIYLIRTDAGYAPDSTYCIFCKSVYPTTTEAVLVSPQGVKS